MHMHITRNFRQFILRKYPALRDNEPFLRFFHYLCFSTFFDKATGQLVVPVRTVAEEFCQKPYGKDFNGKAFLEGFQAAVLPALTWGSYESPGGTAWNGKARQITDFGFDQEMRDELQRELRSDSDDLVDLVNGRDHVRQDRYAEQKEKRTRYKTDLGQLALNTSQRKILDYLRTKSAGHLFLRKLDDNKEAIDGAIAQLPPRVQDIRHRILRQVRRDPNVYYRPSRNGRTCRLSANGDSIVGLKREVRRAATAGWIECDLRSSQFAILASTLRAPKAQAFIATGQSIWREFNRFLVDTEADPTSDVKAVMKEAIYSLCFGKSVTNLRKFLRTHGMARLLKHPILEELLGLRKKWFEEIERAGGALDVWGEWHAVTEDRWAGAVAGTVIQSMEMEIIAPIFEVAEKHAKSDQFTIAFFQHDGATISFNSRAKMARAQRKLRDAVSARAKALGVSTVLEFTAL